MSIKRIVKIAAYILFVIITGYSVYSMGLDDWLQDRIAEFNDRSDGASEQAAPPDDSSSEGAEEDVQEDTEEVMTVEEFSRDISDEESGEQTTVKGERATLDEDELYRIMSPVIISMVQPDEEGGGVDARIGEVRLVAETAIFNEDAATVDMRESVRATGDDFSVETTQVTYFADDQKVDGNEHVRMKRFRNTEGGKELTMVIDGKGLGADLVVQKGRVKSDVEAKLLDVSEDFLAAGRPDEEDGDGLQDVVIRSDGPMIYDEGVRRITFRDNVRVVSGEKRLQADKLEISLDAGNDSGKVQVREITASGQVRIKYRDQKASGDEFVWEDVTQTGTLTGDEARVERSNFSVTASHMTFLRLDNRFQVRDAGTLIQKPTRESGDADAGEAMGLARDKPVTVTWEEGMKYDTSNQRANFEGKVHVKQEDTSLTCEDLALRFDNTGEELKRASAEKDVTITHTDGDETQEVECAKAVWEAGERAIQMSGEGDDGVVVTAGTERLESSKVRYVTATNRFECPRRGKLNIERQETANDATAGAMEVEWQDWMLYERTEQPEATFYGDVVITQPGRTLGAEFLRVRFGENRAPEHIIASQDAVLEVKGEDESEEDAPGREEDSGLSALGRGKTDWTLRADRLEGFLLEDRLEAEREGELRIHKDNGEHDSIRWSRRMEADFQQSTARFYGDVEAAFENSLLQTESMKLDFNSDRELRHVNCSEKVRFESGGETNWILESGSAEAIFAPGSVLSQIIARDDVSVKEAERRLNSQFLTLFFREGKDAGNRALHRAVARKDVKVNYVEDTELEAFGDRLDWNADQDRYRLSGDPAKLQRGGMETEGQTIVIDRGSGEPAEEG
ncbi:MAG: LptA/OstA family protein [Planctomycetota bacterium]